MPLPFPNLVKKQGPLSELGPFVPVPREETISRREGVLNKLGSAQASREVRLCRAHQTQYRTSPFAADQSTGRCRSRPLKTTQPAASSPDGGLVAVTSAASLENLRPAGPCAKCPGSVSPSSPTIALGAGTTSLLHTDKETGVASKWQSRDPNPVNAHTSLAANQPRSSQANYFFLKEIEMKRREGKKKEQERKKDVFSSSHLSPSEISMCFCASVCPLGKVRALSGGPARVTQSPAPQPSPRHTGDPKRTTARCPPLWTQLRRDTGHRRARTQKREACCAHAALSNEPAAGLLGEGPAREDPSPLRYLKPQGGLLVSFTHPFFQSRLSSLI